MELVEVRNKEIYCDSSLLASKFKMKHNKVVRTIETVIPNLGDFMGTGCTPTIHKEKRNYRGRDYDAYILNKDAFLVIMMRFDTKLARRCQGMFIAAFNAMEQRLLVADSNASDPEFLKIRNQGKITRLQETDVIKAFVDYATEQGSKKANFYYKHITNSCYRALGLLVQNNPKLRDTMDIMELAELQLMENRAGVLLKKYMKLGRNYKDIYNSLKNDLAEFGSGLKLEGVDK